MWKQFILELVQNARSYDSVLVGRPANSFCSYGMYPAVSQLAASGHTTKLVIDR